MCNINSNNSSNIDKILEKFLCSFKNRKMLEISI